MSADLTHPHDRFFRRIWSRKGIARDFLAHYLPREVVERLALDTLEFSSVISSRHVIEQSYPWPAYHLSVCPKTIRALQQISSNGKLST